MNTLRLDVKYGLRALLARPGFSLLVIVILALGIGANTAVFSVVQAVLLRTLPYRDAGRIVSVAEINASGHRINLSGQDFLDWQRQSRSFQAMAAYAGWPMDLSAGHRAERVNGAVVTAGFFHALGASPVLGRAFSAEEHRPGHDVAILSEGLWQRDFGGDPAVLGKTVLLEGKPFTIVGVMPAGIDFPQRSEVWMPLEFMGDITSYGARSAHNFQVIARLKPGITMAQADAEMHAVAAHLAQQYPDSNAGIGAGVISLRQELVGDTGPALLVLMTAIGFVLLIACANIANLLLARAVARRREIAVRMSLGASRHRIIRQMLVESVLLAGVGGVVGLAVCAGLMRALGALAPPRLLAMGHFNLDLRVLAVTAALALTTGVLCGIAPAWRVAGTDPGSALQQAGSRSRLQGDSRRLQNVLVVSEVALSLVLLAGAGLMARSFIRMQAVRLGFRSDHVLTATVSLPSLATAYQQPEQVAGFYDRLLTRVEALPGVESAAVTSGVPVGDNIANGDFEIAGRPPKPAPDSIYRVVSAGYFQTLGMPLVHGRDFSSADRAGTPPVVVINQAMARAFWPGQDPLGQRIRYYGFDRRPQWLTVIGIVADARDLAITRSGIPEAYVPYTQHLDSGLDLLVRAHGDAALLTAGVRQVVQGIDPEVPVEVRLLSGIVSNALAPSRFSTVLLGAFAALALLLAGAGIYGVMAGSVERRTGEIGVRMALGAQRRQVLGMVLWQGMGLALAGIALGGLAALLAAPVLAHQLYQVKPADPLTFAAVILVVALLAALASLVPARRATKVDPMEALRWE